MADETMLEPLKAYPLLKEKLNQAIDEYFKELTEKSGVDIGLNKEICTRYYKADGEYKEAAKKLGSIKGLRIFLVVMLLALIVGAVVLFVMSSRNSNTKILFMILGIVCAVLAVGDLISIFTAVKRTIAARQKKTDELKAKADSILKEAEESMKGMNALLDDNIVPTILNKTNDLIVMEPNFSAERYQYFREQYGLEDNSNQDIAIVNVLSGTILGNPFLMQKQFAHHTISKTYTGTLVIHWTTTSTDSNGKLRVEHHTQTLVAHVDKPAPDYNYETFLVYGSDAAPDLSFTRYPTVKLNDNEKDYAKMASKADKELKKMQEASIKKGGSFTPLGNSEFEALFHAWDRDHETQFRLLFTPLGQKNELALLKSKQPYGDDFTFLKRKKLNYISSEHSQNIDYDPNGERFQHFDYEVMKANFSSSINEIFQGLYFDLMPLISIPLYQQYKSVDYIYGKDTPNVSAYEHEAVANSFPNDFFQHEDSITSNIVKTQFVKKVGMFDQVDVTAHGFRGVPRTDYVPTLGGDGLMHPVPVHWTEYIDVEKTTPILVAASNTPRPQLQTLLQNDAFKNLVERLNCSSFSYNKRIMAFVTSAQVTEADSKEFSEILNPPTPIDEIKKKMAR